MVLLQCCCYVFHREINGLFAPQVHLELLYYPFGKQEGGSNPFASQIQLTSLEKVLKTESNGFDVNQRKNVIMRGVLSVTVISAEDLPAMDVMGKADPFVVLYLKKGETKKKTRVKYLLSVFICSYIHYIFPTRDSLYLQVVTETLNPIWNQTFDFVVEDALHDLLMVEVWDHDTFGKVLHTISFFLISVFLGIASYVPNYKMFQLFLNRMHLDAF
jgi:hypothetical protein